MTDTGAAFQPGTEEVPVPFRSRTAYVGFKAFGSGEGAVLVRPEVSHQLRTAAEFATQEGRITGGLLYGRFWVDEQGGYLVIDGYLEAGPGENSGDRIGSDGTDDFTLGEADLRLLHEDAARMYSGSLEVGWWRTRATLGEFGPQDFETQAELVTPDGAGLLVYGSGLHWGTAYLGPDGLAPDSAGTLAAVADDPAQPPDLGPPFDPAVESVTEYAPDPGPQVIDLAHGESLLEEPPEETAVLPGPPAGAWPTAAAPDEGLAEPLLPPVTGTAPARRVRRTRSAPRPRVPSRVRVPGRRRTVREPDPEYSAGPELPADVILVVGALVVVTVIAAIIIGVLVHSSTVAVIIGVIGLVAVFSTVWMSHR
ncbi:MAG TPA: hypothetical protein VGD91_26960 [Trebonia sp.]